MSWLRDLPITWSRRVTTYMIYSHDLDTWPPTLIYTHGLDMWPTNFILISSHHRYQHLHHHFIITSWSFIYTTTFFHHYGTCLQRVWWPSVGLEQGALEVYKKDYFKINASPRSGGGSVKGSAFDRYIKNTTGRSHKWSGKGKRLARRGLVWTFGMSTSASTILHIIWWVEVRAK